ncbi:hypothetical protein J5N97_001675 [Dioscorea zingiberensis]|uniref:Uncharacterized protein n=1 Tax=Dioscorea zingiberensis TaxID=325984 RepID=A0A9D5H286_9LILI|nr:hypothetical protein J5N97_001675 [Dioscorea zingiberensis]
MGPLSLSQAPATPAAPPPSPNCNGIELSYNLDSRELIHSRRLPPQSAAPRLPAPPPLILNSKHRDSSHGRISSHLQQHRELIIYASPAVLLDDSPFPYTTPQDSPTSFSGFPNTDLKTPIETVNDLSQIHTSIPLPRRPFYRSFAPDLNFNSTTSISSCYLFDPTVGNSTAETFFPYRSGDFTAPKNFTISYDAIPVSSPPVTSPLGRLDNRQWMHDELGWKCKYHNLTYEKEIFMF